MIKNWQAASAAVLATIGILAAIGFLSPSSRAEKTENAIIHIDDRLNGHDIDIVGMKKDIDYTARGIEALLENQGLTPRRTRRSR